MLLVWLLASNPAALNAYLHAYAISPTAFFLVLALALLILPRPGPVPLVAAGAATAAMLLCRHDMIPVGLVLWAYMLWRGRIAVGWRVAAVLTSWLLFGLALLPYMLAAPMNVLWALSLGKIGPHLAGTDTYGMAAPFSPRTLAWHTMIFIRYYGGPLLLMLPGLAGIYRARRSFPGWEAAALCLWVAGFNWFSHIPLAIISGANIFYLLDLYIFFPAAIVAAVLYAWVLTASQQRDCECEGIPEGNWTLLSRAVVCFAVLAICVPVFTGPGPHFQFSLAHPTALEQVRRGAEALRQYVRPGEVIFTVDDPHQFLEAGLELPHELTHQMFTYRDDPNTEALRSVHYFNDAMIREWLGGTAQVAVISEGYERWMGSSERYSGGPRLRRMIRGLLAENYRLVAEVPGTLNGPLRIYRRK